MLFHRSILLRAGIVFAAGAAAGPASVSAAGRHNPTSKLFVADLDGESQIDTGERVDDLNKQSVYNAEGTVVETKPNASNALVFSNGTGVFFDEDTRVEVRKFQQEPFVPNRTDMDAEPSISQTQSYVPRGTVGLCTSKLAAGSSMTYSTPLGSVNINGGKVVISSDANSTTISMLDGQSTVNAGDIDTGGQLLKDGQQAVITPSHDGGPPHVRIQNIPNSQRQALNQKVTMACNAKKTVYFEVRGRSKADAVIPLNAPVTAATTLTGTGGSTTSGSSSAPATGGISAFDGDDGAVTTTPTPTTTGTSPQEIVAVPVAPSTTPVQNTQSQANLVTTSGSP